MRLVKQRQLDAQIVVVHEETLWEAVEPGTNTAHKAAPYVDILAHPSPLSQRGTLSYQWTGCDKGSYNRRQVTGQLRHARLGEPLTNELARKLLQEHV